MQVHFNEVCCNYLSIAAVVMVMADAITAGMTVVTALHVSSGNDSGSRGHDCSNSASDCDDNEGVVANQKLLLHLLIC